MIRTVAIVLYKEDNGFIIIDPALIILCSWMEPSGTSPMIGEEKNDCCHQSIGVTTASGSAKPIPLRRNLIKDRSTLQPRGQDRMLRHVEGLTPQQRYHVIYIEHVMNVTVRLRFESREDHEVSYG